jgi:broad specificity phosphatase PhoE
MLDDPEKIEYKTRSVTGMSSVASDEFLARKSGDGDKEEECPQQADIFTTQTKRALSTPEFGRVQRLGRPLCGSLLPAACLECFSNIIAEASARYAQKRRPRRLLLVRHGESLGNTDSTAYGRIPDSQMPLTAKGYIQAGDAGDSLAQLIGEDESILALISPYKRTQETFKGIQHQLGNRVRKVIHEPNLREQDFGNFQDPHDMGASLQERQKFGRFFYRFPHGESGADVYSRAESFMSSLFRHMDNPNRARHDNVLIVSHGIVMRMILMRFLRWTVEEYEQVYNPDNCEIWMLTRDDYGEYSLVRDCDIPGIKSPVAGIGDKKGDIDERLTRCNNRRTSETYGDQGDTSRSLSPQMGRRHTISAATTSIEFRKLFGSTFGG